MDNSRTPKIVVGVGLVAVYAAGLAVFALRGKHDNEVAQNLPSAVSTPMAAEAAAPALALALAVPESTDSVASQDAPSPAASVTAAMPAPIAPTVGNAAKAPETTPPSVASQPRAQEVPVESLPSPRPPAPGDGEDLSRSNSGSSVVSDLAGAQSDTGEAIASAEETPSAEDSQNTEAPASENSDQ